MTKKEDKKTLAELFGQLETVVKELEGEEVTLEDSFTFYNQGMELLKECNEIIDTVEKKVRVLDTQGEEDEF